MDVHQPIGHLTDGAWQDGHELSKLRLLRPRARHGPTVGLAVGGSDPQRGALGFVIEEREQLPQNLALADADGGGTIDKSEFGDLLAQSGVTAGSNDLAALFAEADKDGDGELTVDEIKSLGDRNRNKFKAQN